MNRSIEQISLDIEAAEALISKLSLDEAGPLIREFDKLKGLILDYARQRSDDALVGWIKDQQTKVRISAKRMANACAKAYNMKMKRLKSAPHDPKQTVLLLEHEEALTRNALQEVQLHIELIRKLTLRAKEKLLEIGK